MSMWQLGRLAKDLSSWAGRQLGPEAKELFGLARARVTRRLLGHDFEQRLGMLRRRYQDRGPDPFGLDLDAVEQALRVCGLLHRAYFRTEVKGIEGLPEGRVLLVANHSGQVPLDAVIIAAACFFDAPSARLVRALFDRWAHSLPFVSTLLCRLGQVVGVPENGRRLLGLEETVLAFPEGIRGISKPFSRRYRLEPFGRGFMRLALETRTPIVPVAVVGAEEQYVSLGNLEWVARRLGTPVFPLMPQLLLPGGQLPLPTRYHLHFGDPLVLAGDPEDDALVESQVARVKDRIALMLEEGLRARRGVFF